MFPGLDWSSRHWSELAEQISAAVFRTPDTYIVHREELPEADWDGALAAAFGAEEGDLIIEIRTGKRSDETSVRRWVLGDGPEPDARADRRLSGTPA